MGTKGCSRKCTIESFFALYLILLVAPFVPCKLKENLRDFYRGGMYES